MLGQLVYFYLAIFLVFFMPGYFLLRVIFVKNYSRLSSLEKLLITFVFSLAVTDGIMLLMNYLHIAITRKNLLLGIFGASLLFGLLQIVRIFISSQNKKKSPSILVPKSSIGSPAYRQILLFIVLLGFSVFLRSVYIADGIFPKTTDFGHHMYWANYISTNHTLPIYDEKFIIGEHLPFAAINILSGVTYISSLPTIILLLFNIFTLIGVFILTYWLAMSFSNVFQKIFPHFKKILPYDIALWGLFIIGILYPISAPQVKFVSGGVIGNIIGNLLIITAIYAFFKSITAIDNNKDNKSTKQKVIVSDSPFLPIRLHLYLNKNTSFPSLFIIALVTMVYTHHLSSFIFGYSFIAILFSFIILTLIFVKFNLLKFFKLVFLHFSSFFPFFPLSETISRFVTPLAPVIIMFLTIFFLLQVRTPSYLNPEAIDVAVGTPTKITRVGFGFSQIAERVGSWKILFAGIFGVIGGWVLLLFLKNIYTRQSKNQTLSDIDRSLKAGPFAPLSLHSKGPALLAPSRALTQPYFVSFALAFSILFAWAGILFLMSWKPGLLKVDIPSRRIVTYLTYPIAIMASFGFAYFFAIIQSKLSKQMVSFLFLFFMGIGIISGLGQDITTNQRTTAGKFKISSTTNSREVMQTYLASIYLADNTPADEMILKDHKFLEGDTWMKIFFMRGYKYPLSRTYDRRYEDVINKRETCTRDMVLKPDSEIGQQCFNDTGTRYVVLKKGFDDGVFLRSPEFQLVYTSKDVVVFEKK